MSQPQDHVSKFNREMLQVDRAKEKVTLTTFMGVVNYQLCSHLYNQYFRN